MFSRICKLFSGFMSIIIMLPQSGVFAAQKSSDIPIKAFAQLRMTTNLKLSPDGKYIAYFTPYKGHQVIIIKPMGAGQSVAVPPAEGTELAWFKWAKNDRLVFSYAFTASRKLNSVTTRETRLFAVDPNGRNRTNLIRARDKNTIGTRLGKELVASQIQDDVIDWLPDDPDHILIAIDGNIDGKYEVRRVNIYTGKFKEIIAGFRGIQNYATDQQHIVRLAWGYELSQFHNMYKSPLTNKWKNVEKTSWGDKGFDLLGFTKDPIIAYAAGNNEQGRKAVFKINLETEEILAPVFSHERVDYDGIIYHPLTGKPIGVQYTVDKPEIIYFDKDLRSIQKTVDKALPDTVNVITNILPDKKQYMIYSSSDEEPGVYYLLDMMLKKLDFISETMPGIAPENMSAVKSISYKTRDGVDIPAYLTIPKGKEAKNLPVVIYVHGGPQYRDDQMFNHTVQFLASRGYAVLQPNFRGSKGYGQEFENKGKYQWGGIMQDDVTDGTKWLIEQGIANPKKICILGASYGGYAAAMGLVKVPDLYKCGVSISAVFDIPYQIATDKKYIGGRAWAKILGLEGADPETVSPYYRADEIKSPLLIIHAKDDNVVLYKQGQNMAQKLKKLKKKVTFITMENGAHNMDTEKSRIIKLTAIEKFLKKHIGH